MLVPWQVMDGNHRRTAQCKKGSEQKRRHLAAEEERAFTCRAFSAYGTPLDMATSFKFLGRVISTADNDWTEVYRNLAEARVVWRSLTRTLSR